MTLKDSCSRRTGDRLLLAAQDEHLSLALSGEGYVVTVEKQARLAIEQARANAFDVMLLQVNLPDQSGFEICRTLRQGGLTTPIVMIGHRALLSDKLLGLRLGADDYLTKPFELAELLARMQALLRRTRESGLSECCFGNICVDFFRRRVLRKGRPVNLSMKEFDLLRYLVSRQNTALSREELLKEVWGYSSTATRTVDVHVSTLRQKLEDNPQHPRYILTVRRHGYMFCSESSSSSGCQSENL